MAPVVDGTAVAALRAVTYRISATPVDILPQIIPHITNTLSACRPILSHAQSGKAKGGNEVDTLVHKFNTQISSLLQDRTVEGRWAAVVLVKSAIELGGLEILQTSGPWVRALLGFLSKPDPPTLKKLYMLTLTRIFTLTREHSGLVREITTPSLPTFVEKCLYSIGARHRSSGLGKTGTQRALLGTVLESFNQLLPRHPTIFRSYAIQIRNLTTQVISQSSASGCTLPEGTVDAARRLSAQLPFTASKGEGATEWNDCLVKLVRECHRTSDLVFRAVIEEWEPASGASYTGHKQNVSQSHEVEETEPGLGLSPWNGIFAGAERLTALLNSICQYLSNTTPMPVKLPMGRIVDLLVRLLTIRVALPGDQYVSNNQISKEERSHLFAVLPAIHVATVDILLALHQRVGTMTIPLSQTFLSHLLWVFRAERSIPSIRAKFYNIFKEIIDLVGPTLEKQTVTEINFWVAIEACCNDLLASSPASAREAVSAINGTNGAITNGVTDSTNSLLRAPPTDTSHLYAAATLLLSTLISRLPVHHLPSKTSSLLTKTAVLTQTEDALLARALNPDLHSGKASILPLLARVHPNKLSVEGLLRPRMPVYKPSQQPVTTNETNGYGEDEAVEEDLEISSGAMEVEAMPNPPDPLPVEGSSQASQPSTALLLSRSGETITSAFEKTPAEFTPENWSSQSMAPISQSAQKRTASSEAHADTPKRPRVDQSAVAPANSAAQSFVTAPSGTQQSFSVTMKRDHDDSQERMGGDVTVNVEEGNVQKGGEIDIEEREVETDDDSGSDVEIPMINIDDSDDSDE